MCYTSHHRTQYINSISYIVRKGLPIFLIRSTLRTATPAKKGTTSFTQDTLVHKRQHLLLKPGTNLFAPRQFGVLPAATRWTLSVRYGPRTAWHASPE